MVRAKSLRVDLGPGADRLSTLKVTIRRRAVFLGGAGDDTLLFEAGADWVEAIGCTFQAPVRAQTSDGEDTVYVATSRFRRVAVIKTGLLDDEIEIERATFDAVLRVNGGGLGGASGSGGSGKFYWRFVIVHVPP